MVVPPPLISSTIKFCFSLIGQSLRQYARDLIGRPAGGIRHDDRDGVVRIGLRQCRHDKGEKTDNSQCNCSRALHHRVLPT